MPRKQIDYSKTIIYKIVCRDLSVTNCYVGSTTDFICRKNSHKMECNCETHKQYNYKVYKTIRNNGGWDNWNIIEIEKYPCNDGNEARARERHWYETLKADMNGCVPNRSKAEYNKINHLKYANIHKDYRERNKESIECGCGGKYKIYHKSTHSKKQKHMAYLAKLLSQPTI